MKYREAFKEGIRVINRNLPLVLIQIGVMFLSFLLFVMLVGIPVAIAIIYLGIDLVRFKETLTAVKDPIEFLYKYSGIAIFIVTTFVVYLTAVTGIALFVFGGNIAIIKDSIKDPTERFSIKHFLKEGKRYFLPLCWLTLLLGISFLIFIFVIGAIIGVAIILLEPYKNEMIGKFMIVMAIILGMTLLLIAFLIFLLLVAFSIYAVIALIIDELRAWKAIKRSFNFIKDNFLQAIGFYLLLIMCYFVAVILMVLINFPFSLIPLIGPIISFPFKILTYIVQVYLGLVMMASLVSLYMKKSVRP